MITIFTPTYNRSYIIKNLYHSLCNQEIKNFEWLVVDDGSTDDTEQLFKSLIAEQSDFSIRYYKTNNGGKHRATNLGLNNAVGEIFFPVDSDDILTSDATKKIERWFDEIKKEKNLCGITANKGYFDGTSPNKFFKSEYIDKTFLEVNTYRENNEPVLAGERAICIYTDVFRKFNYPEFENEKFVTEAVSYNRIANAGYKTRFFNDIIYLYEYRNDGLTHSGNSLFVNNPYGYGLWLKEKDQFMNKSFIDKLKTYYSFTCELKDKYDDKLIAECIDVPFFLIKVLKSIHKTITSIRK